MQYQEQHMLQTPQINRLVHLFPDFQNLPQIKLQMKFIYWNAHGSRKKKLLESLNSVFVSD